MFANPLKILKTIPLRENDIVADLGAGTGHYSVIAGMLAPKGKIYAVEIEKDFLDTIKGKVKDPRIENVEVIWGNVEKPGGTKIGDGIVDVAIASNILFLVDDKEKFIDEIRRILKPNGKVLLVDWDSSIIEGARAVKTVPQEKALAMFEKKNFFLDRIVDAGNHHYGMI